MENRPTQREYWSGKVGNEWAVHADRIDAMLAPVTDVALELGAFRAGERVLDIGSGAGVTALEIARRVGAGGAVVGVDLSPQMLDVARERAAGVGLPVEFVEADAGSAALGACFDAAFSRFGVMFFEAPAPAFAHIRSGMCEGGRLVFVCWRTMAENKWGTTAIEAVQPMLKAPLPAPDPTAPGPFSLADADKIRRVLDEAGWRDVQVTAWDGLIPAGGGGTIEETADFMIKIGPCARAIADQALDLNEARRRLVERLTPLFSAQGVLLPAACWVVTARA
jgi:SAM-dependent methyltransferase